MECSLERDGICGSATKPTRSLIIWLLRLPYFVKPTNTCTFNETVAPRDKQAFYFPRCNYD